jgi:hypothetical protein
MARLLIYVVLAADVVALIVGFFIKSTSLPLWVSTGLSVGVAILILFGWSRVVRDEDVDAASDEELEDLDVDEEPAEKRARRSRRKAPLPETISFVAPDESLFAPEEPRAAEPEPRAAKPRPRSVEPKPRPVRPKPRPLRPKPRSVRSKPQAPAKPTAARRKPAKAKAPARRTANRSVAVVPGASKYHKPTCRFAQSDNVRMVPERIAKERGYVACGICKP